MRRMGALVGTKASDADRSLPAKAQWKAHNYNHLLEQPVLFYALCAILTLADSVGYVDRVGDRPDLTEYNQKVRRACPDGASPPAKEQRQTGAGSIPAEGCSKRVRGSSGA